MGLFSRRKATVDLLSSPTVAAYGRAQFLGEADHGGDRSIFWFDETRPWFNAVHQAGPSEKAAALAELWRHAQVGEWEAIGAWKLGIEYLEDSDIVDGRPWRESVGATAMLALQRMRVTNLYVHLPFSWLDAYTEVTGERPPNDGFFGPPVFDSSFGPSRQYYYDAALAAAAARSPRRVPHAPGVHPGELPPELLGKFWDFSILVLRGPLLTHPDNRFEPTLRTALEAHSSNVDHQLFVQQVMARLDEEARAEPEVFRGWIYLGAGRFLEESLTPELTSSPVHEHLIDVGLGQAARLGMVGVAFDTDVLTPFERTRWVSLESG